MSRSSKSSLKLESGLIEVKSKFDAEFRRFSVRRQGPFKFEEFFKTLENLHHLKSTPFIVCYTDPTHGDLLPINNDDNYQKALSTAKPLLRLLVQRKGEASIEMNGYGTVQRKRNVLTKLVANEPRPRPAIQISLPEDFRRVSAIIDVDVIPETHRRVKLMKNGSDKPLGFYIRDGTSVRLTPHGLEKVPGIFISRLVPGGLAESTGLLAVNDEVLEVNGIEVAGKTLDQVTDMMVANSSNLIITVKPVNQHNNICPRSGSGRSSIKPSPLTEDQPSMDSNEGHDITEDDDEDEIRDHIQEPEATGSASGSDKGDEQTTTEIKDSELQSERKPTDSQTEKTDKDPVLTL